MCNDEPALFPFPSVGSQFKSGGRNQRGVVLFICALSQAACSPAKFPPRCGRVGEEKFLCCHVLFLRVEHKQHQHPSLTCHSEHAMSKFSRHVSEKLNVRKMFLSSSKMRTLFVSEIGSSHCPTISYIQRLMRHGPYYFTQGPDSRAYSTSEGFVSLTLRACAN